MLRMLRASSINKKLTLIMTSCALGAGGLFAVTPFLSNGAVFAAGGTTITVDDNDPTASYSTIQAAVNAASDDTTINVAPGTYREHVSINGKSNLTLVGAGAVIEAPQGNDAAAIEVSSSSNISIDHMIITHDITGLPDGTNSLSRSDAGVSIVGGAKDVKVSNDNKIYNNRGGVYIQNPGTGVYVYGNHIYDNKTGIQATGDLSNTIIDSNYIYGNRTVGASIYSVTSSLSNFIVTNNHFGYNGQKDAKSEIVLKESPDAIGTLTVLSNSFMDSPVTFSNDFQTDDETSTSATTGNYPTVLVDSTGLAHIQSFAPTSVSIVKNSSAVLPGSVVNASFINGDITFSYSKVDGADQYITRVQYPNGQYSSNIWNSSDHAWIVNGGAVVGNAGFGQHGDGIYTFQVKARNGSTDQWSDWSDASTSLVYDTAAPALGTVTYGSRQMINNIVLKQSDIFTVNLNEKNPNRTYIEVQKLVNNKWQKIVGDWSTGASANMATLPFNTNGFDEGAKYQLKISTDDAAWNHSGFTIPFTVDNTPPTVTVKPESVGDGKIYRSISFKLYDAGKIDKVVINGVEKDLTDNTWSDVNDVKPGVFGARQYGNVIVVYDVAGNSSSFNFTLDNTAPSVWYNAPSNEATLNNNDVIKVGYHDDTEAATAEVQIVGESYDRTFILGLKDGEIAIPVANLNLVDGSYTIRTVITDAAGNRSVTGDRRFTLDATAPSVSIGSVVPLANATTIVTGRVNDNAATVVVYLDGATKGTEAIVQDGLWTWTSPTILTNGDHTVAVIATDAAGNSSSVDIPTAGDAFMTFIVDSTAAMDSGDGTGVGTGTSAGTQGGSSLTSSKGAEGNLSTVTDGGLATMTATNARANVATAPAPTIGTEADTTTTKGASDGIGKTSSNVLGAQTAKKTWSLVNALVAIVMVLIGVVTLFGWRSKDNQQKQHHGFARVCVVLLAVGACILFFAVEHVSSSMIWVDGWTIPMAVLATTQALFANRTGKNKESE